MKSARGALTPDSYDLCLSFFLIKSLHLRCRYMKLAMCFLLSSHNCPSIVKSHAVVFSLFLVMTSWSPARFKRPPESLQKGIFLYYFSCCLYF